LKLLIGILIFNFFLIYQASGQNIFDTEAGKHIGENRSVSGKVNTYKILADSTTMLLFCGTHYPERYFVIIVKKSNENFTRSLNHLKGWQISVTGLIIKYDGMPAIKVSGWEETSTWLAVDSTPPDDI